MNYLEEQAEIWLKARDIIADALRGINLDLQTQQWYEHNAAAIIARLAKQGLLICTEEEMKDVD